MLSKRLWVLISWHFFFILLHSLLMMDEPLQEKARRDGHGRCNYEIWEGCAEWLITAVFKDAELIARETRGEPLLSMNGCIRCLLLIPSLVNNMQKKLQKTKGIENLNRNKQKTWGEQNGLDLVSTHVPFRVLGMSDVSCLDDEFRKFSFYCNQMNARIASVC